MRVAPVRLVAAGLLLAAPATASADVIFDPADADELAAVLAEATATRTSATAGTCQVSDAVAGSRESVGSNFGAGQPVSSGTCQKTCRVQRGHHLHERVVGVGGLGDLRRDQLARPASTRADLDGLGIDFDGLTGEDPDVVIGKAVTALPLLAADAGMAQADRGRPGDGRRPRPTPS